MFRSMDRGRLMAMVEMLGTTFATRGMKRHVEELRVYWLGLARGLVPAGRRVDVGWSESLVVEWFRVLRLPPHQWDYPVRPPSSPCPRCPAPDGHAVEVKTGLTFPEGRKAVCTVCGYAWLELEADVRAASVDVRRRAR
ncbi:MAG TPA: hypothetical protein VMH40_10630 [Myxococcaceae bacterium]|nr:hypothetical protein [Myxococcaceae bacterium]